MNLSGNFDDLDANFVDLSGIFLELVINVLVLLQKVICSSYGDENTSDDVASVAFRLPSRLARRRSSSSESAMINAELKLTLCFIPPSKTNRRHASTAVSYASKLENVGTAK